MQFLMLQLVMPSQLARATPKKPANVPGVAFSDVKSDEAIAACLTAYASNPDNPRIAFQIGRAYETAGKEDEKQFEYYGIAAAKGYIIAPYNFGQMHNRPGIHKNEVVRNTYLCKAADAGFGLAFVGCGYAHEKGIGAPKDQQKAVNWYQKGADSGDALALADLGYMYETGAGVPKDVERATALYKQSAELGESLGMNNYGNNLIRGHGTSKNVQLGLEYLNKSIAAGETVAPVSLAEHLDEGINVPYDAQKSAQNFLIGLKLNDEQAVAILVDKMGAGLKPATLDAIQNQLKAEGKVFEASANVFSPAVIAVLKDYPAK